MKPLSFLHPLLFLFILGTPHLLFSQTIELPWELREDLNILLPQSVEVYGAQGKLADGKPVKAVYAIVDLSDENLKLRALGRNDLRLTTEEISEQNNGILAINGGYFSVTASVSLLVSDGQLISPGLHPEVAKGGFALKEGKPDIFWTNAGSETSDPLVFEDPENLRKGKALTAEQAVGGGPVLIQDSKIQINSKAEGFGGSHLLRHPRTAIGYREDGKLILLVVDGRQEASAGVTLPELAEIMQSLGAVEALNLDGGGSSAMVAAGEVVNIPADIPNGNRNSLRRNASALVLSQIRDGKDKAVYLFDTNGPEYSENGLWKATNQVNYYGKSLSRTAAAGLPYNKARYDFNSVPRKEYQLAAWWAVNTEQNSENTAYVLNRNSSTDTIYLDQSSLDSGGKWNVLGNFILGEGDYLEITGASKEGSTVADAIRLVEVQSSPELPVRGDLRIAVISDLNSGLGAADYEWQVDSIINRIPRIWSPDLVLCGGDMVAGMGISDSLLLQKMWAGFDEHIAAPLKKANIPFAFTLGNHDGPRSYPLEQKAARDYWQDPTKQSGLKFVDKSFFPNYYSFVQDGLFIVSWEASSSEITEANLEWLEQQFQTPEAKAAKLRFVMGHMPMYSVAQERDSKGNVLAEPEKLQALLEKYQVHTYISGHQHAYYPGKRGALEFLNTGAAGSGPRAWLTQEKSPVNTITIMDIFYGQDSIAYSTYEIKESRVEDMQLFEEKELPSAMFGVNGHVLRRDIALSGRASGALGDFGTVTAEIKNGELLVSGSYSGLTEKLLNTEAIALYRGRNSEERELLKTFRTSSRKKAKGSFRGSIPSVPSTRELLAIGAYFVKLDTENGSFRAQLYPETNKAPQAPKILSHNDRNIYGVRDLEALYELEWTPALDSDGDFVTYTYQLARDSAFTEIVLHETTGRTARLKKTEQDWFRLLGDAPEGEAVVFYHRVLASDGKNTSASPALPLKLMKSGEPLTDFIEVPAPNYLFTGKIPNAEGAGMGARWDHSGKLWLADYSGALMVFNPDGSETDYSPIRSVQINGQEYRMSPVNGIGIDLDGNILIGRNRHLLKIDASTRKGIAVWEVPEGERAITAPRVSENGEIYAMSLFADDPNYVLRQSTEDPSGFELLRTLDLKDRILSRSFAMTPDGKTLYFPDPGSALIQQYTSKDGKSYVKAKDILSTASGSSGVEILQENGLFAAVRASGIFPSSFHYRNEKQQQMWTLELPEVNGAEPRGIGVSPDGRTLIFCSYDKGGGFYRYELKD